MLVPEFLAIVIALGGNSLLATANFPSEPIAVEGANITETNAIGTVDKCQAILVAPAEGEDVKCGLNGIIAEQGIVPVNMWPNQPVQATAADCAIYCQNRIGDYYRSFGIYPTKSNMTIGYKCECYDSGVGALKLARAAGSNVTSGAAGSGVFYDTKCFLLEC